VRSACRLGPHSSRRLSKPCRSSGIGWWVQMIRRMRSVTAHIDDTEYMQTHVPLRQHRCFARLRTAAFVGHKTTELLGFDFWSLHLSQGTGSGTKQGWSSDSITLTGFRSFKSLSNFSDPFMYTAIYTLGYGRGV
jgi:hypothetical protein